MIQSPAGYQGDVRIKRYLDFYQAGYGVAMLSSGTTAFTPASLFAASEPGGWYDPSDLTTLYQDAAGTTPVTAVEQPVGLVLDKSRGLVLGSELVSNGTFDSNTNGWTAQSGASIARDTSIFTNGGLLVTANGGSNSYATQTVSGLTVGTRYVLSASVYTPSTNTSDSRATIGIQGAAFTLSGSRPQTTLNTIQTISLQFVATGTSQTIYMSVVTSDLYNWGASGSVGYFDNISVRELPGSHLSQSTAAARPVLSARVNALVQTEAPSSASWNIKANISISSGVSDPDGGTTAFTVTATAADGRLLQSAANLSGSGIASIWMRRRTGTGAINWEAPGVGVGGLISLTSSWQRVSYTSAPPGGGTWYYGLRIADANDAIDIWHPDLRPANAGVGLPAYQRVGAATDYDTTGFPLYLKFDGTDDSLSSAAINFTSTDKMSVFAGVRKLSVDVGIIYELSGNWNTNDGSFQSASTNPGFDAASRGTAAVSGATQVASVVASVPATAVLTASHDIAGDLTAHRLNGAAAVNATGDKGSGNFGNYPFYVGNRFNNPPTTPSSLRFNGHLYSLIVRGAATDAATITATETWVNGKTKAF